MNKMKKLLLILLCFSLFGFGQNSLTQYESKEIAEYRAVKFLTTEILGNDKDKEITAFFLDALSASITGEITTLFYHCKEKKKTGLLIGFFNINWVPGATFERYSFLNLNLEEATEFLNTIGQAHNAWKNPRGEYEEQSIFFKINEITVVMDMNYQYMRIFWKDFNSDLGYNSFLSTKKRFEKKRWFIL